jgi:hypothetical protein
MATRSVRLGRLLLACGALLAPAPAHVGAPAAASADRAPAIHPDVRAQVSAGRTRVLVELRVPDADARADAIARAQDAVLARVPGVLVRRYRSVPLLALEIDASGLRALDALGDVVARVEPDRPVAPQ